jgi:hypothetical protein
MTFSRGQDASNRSDERYLGGEMLEIVEDEQRPALAQELDRVFQRLAIAEVAREAATELAPARRRPRAE